MYPIHRVNDGNAAFDFAQSDAAFDYAQGDSTQSDSNQGGSVVMVGDVMVCIVLVSVVGVLSWWA